MATTKEWSTESFLTDVRDAARPNAMIILNTPLPHHHLFAKLWDACSVRYCADGGANRLFDNYSKGGARDGRIAMGEEAGAVDARVWTPSLIKGDLDSLRAEVREHYESIGVQVIHDPSQDSTDLGKCLEALVGHEASVGVEHQLIIVGGLSGRLDQTVHTMHALTVLGATRKYTWAVGKDSAACVLMEGTHQLNVSKAWFGDTCAVLPVGQEAKVTTKGLQWDLGPESYAYPTSVATAVSSSNHMPGERVTVTTDVPIVWTMEVRGGSD